MKSFVGLLNQFSCLKVHLAERMIDLACQAPFAKVNFGIRRFVKQIDHEIINLDCVYRILFEQLSFSELALLVEKLDERYNKITDHLDSAQLAHILLQNYLTDVNRALEETLLCLRHGLQRINRPDLESYLPKDNTMPEVMLLAKLKAAYPESFLKFEY